MAPRKRRRKQRPAPPPATWSQHMYLRVKPADMAHLKFLLEGYDNLGYLTMVDKHSAIVRFVFSPHFEKEAREFIEHAQNSLPVEIALDPLAG